MSSGSLEITANKKTMGRFRELWPHIRVNMKNVTLAELRDFLAREHGIDVTLQVVKTYVYRLRKEDIANGKLATNQPTDVEKGLQVVQESSVELEKEVVDVVPPQVAETTPTPEMASVSTPENPMEFYTQECKIPADLNKFRTMPDIVLPTKKREYF